MLKCTQFIMALHVNLIKIAIFIEILITHIINSRYSTHVEYTVYSLQVDNRGEVVVNIITPRTNILYIHEG